MVRLIKISALIFIILFYPLGRVAFAEPIKAYIIQSEPLGYVNEHGENTGIHWKYFQAIAKESGVDISCNLAPKARIINELRRGNIDLAIFFRSTENDDFVYYVKKIRSVPFIAINRKGLPLNSYNDLQHSKSLGIMRNTQINRQFNKDLRSKLNLINSYESMVKMTALKRIDTAIGSSTVLSYLVNKYNLSDSFEPSSCIFEEREQWLHISKKSQNLDMIPVLRKAVEELQKKGILNDILTRQVGSIWPEAK